MTTAGTDLGAHELAIYFLCALAAWGVWTAFHAREIDRRKYSLTSFLSLTGLLATALAVGAWLVRGLAAEFGGG
jgi:hypothetical protein